MQQSNISAIFAKVELFNFGQIKPLVAAISRVSVPISPRQQHHLAFISEFNVQLLYLPGLKNVITDFCPAKTKQPLDQSPPCRRQTQWISMRWPPSKAIARKRISSSCSPKIQKKHF
jgi:hypothetical protein